MQVIVTKLYVNMKKVLLTSVLVACSMGNAVFSQTETNLLNSSGNIGIGTMSPTNKLSVRGSARIDSTLIVDSINVLRGARIRGKLLVAAPATFNSTLSVGKNFRASGPSVFDTTAAFKGKVNMLNLPQSADLKTASFMVAKDGTGAVEKITLNLVGEEMYKFPCLVDVNGNTISPKWSNGPNKIYTSCASVGIGTTAPRSKLDVKGTITAEGLAIGIEPSNALAKFHFKSLLPSNNNSTVFLVENQTGKLLQLSNQGHLKVRDVKVDLVAWPDYVFDKEYQLMPLSEVEVFIKQNGHLPNVPSAKVVETEGLNLGEMNKIFIEKIEQLTLYIIEQEKQIQQLKNHFSNPK